MPAEVVTRGRPSRHRGESDRKPCQRGTWGVAAGIGARRWQRYRRSRGARHEPRHVLPKAAATGSSSRPLRFVPSTVSVLRHSPRPSGFEGLTKPPCFVMPLSKRRTQRRYPEEDVNEQARILTHLESSLRKALRKLHRRQMGRAALRQVLRESFAGERPAALRDRAFERAGH